MAKWTKHPSGVIFSEVQGEPGKQFQHVIEKGLTSGYNLGRIHEDLDEPWCFREHHSTDQSADQLELASLTHCLKPIERVK